MKRTQSEYINKDLAASRSGLSVRRLLELAARGTIRKRHVRDPKSKRQIAVFDARDIAMIKAGGSPAIIDGQKRLTAATGFIPLRSVAAVPQPSPASEIHPTPEPRPWMTAAEAADYSGLPASFLVRFIEAGKLPALDVGVRPGGRWRISKRDLDAIAGKHHKAISTGK